MSGNNQIKKIGWIKPLEKVINKALQLDKETLVSLSELDSKVLVFEFINTKVCLYLFPSAQGLKIETDYADRPDVCIRSTPGNFIKMLISGKDNKMRMPAEMRLMGDIGLAQEFQAIIQSVEIDLEEPLSHWIGDTLAFQVGNLVRGTSRFAANAGKTLSSDLSEYLRYEIGMLPDDLLVEEFCRDVNILREDVDRFSVRWQKLEKKLNQNQGKD